MLLLGAAVLSPLSIADQVDASAFAERWIEVWDVSVPFVPDSVENPETYREAETMRRKAIRADLEGKFDALSEDKKSDVLRSLLKSIPGKYDDGRDFSHEAETATQILEVQSERLKSVLTDQDRIWFRESLKKGPEKEATIVCKLIAATNDKAFIPELSESLFRRKRLLADKLRTLVKLGDSKGLDKAVGEFLAEKSPTEPAHYIFNQLLEGVTAEAKIRILKRLIGAIRDEKAAENALTLLCILDSSHLVQKELAELFEKVWSRSPRNYDEVYTLLRVLEHAHLSKETTEDIVGLLKEVFEDKQTTDLSKGSIITILSQTPEDAFDHLKTWTFRHPTPSSFAQRDAIAGMMSLPERRNQFLNEATKALQEKWGSAEHPGLVHILEEARGYLTSPDQATLDRKMAEASRFFKNHQKDACSVLCGLTENFNQWSQSAGPTTDFESRSQNAAAVYALGMLFMAKAAPFCPNAKKLVKSWLADGKIFSSLVDEKKPPDETQALLMREVKKGDLDLSEEQLKKLSEFISAAAPSGSLERSTPVYAKQFVIGTLLELERQGLISPEDTVLPRTKAEAGLVSELSSFVKLEKIRTWGSLYNTFALATSALQVREIPENAIQGLIAMEKESPLEVPYLPWKENTQYQSATPRGSAARAVPYHLALYRIESDSEKKSVRIENLLAAIQNFVAHSSALRLHALTEVGDRGSPHDGKDGLAAYFYYPGVAYATSATKLLLREKSLSDSQREVLTRLLAQMQADLLALESEGRFGTANLNFMGYGNGSYANPLAGLALIATIDSCNDVTAANRFGIIEPSLVRFGSGGQSKVNGERAPKPSTPAKASVHNPVPK